MTTPTLLVPTRMSDLNNIPIDSSWLHHSTYLTGGPGTGTGTLVIWMSETRAYVYSHVPYWMRGVLHSGGGRAYNRFIKGQYSCQRVDVPAGS